MTLDTLFTKFSSIGNAVIYLLIGLAVIFIIWNAVQFIIHAASDDRKTYQGAIIWGIVGLFVILSIWGLVNILRGTFGFNNGNNNTPSSSDLNSLMIQQQ